MDDPLSLITSFHRNFVHCAYQLVVKHNLKNMTIKNFQKRIFAQLSITQHTFTNYYKTSILINNEKKFFREVLRPCSTYQFTRNYSCEQNTVSKTNFS